MAEKGKRQEKKIDGILPRQDLDDKWQACGDLALHRVTTAAVVGAFAGLLLFRCPVKRWASVAFGAGTGIGSTYVDCNYIFGASSPDLSSPKV